MVDAGNENEQYAHVNGEMVEQLDNQQNEIQDLTSKIQNLQKDLGEQKDDFSNKLSSKEDELNKQQDEVIKLNENIEEVSNRLEEKKNCITKIYTSKNSLQKENKRFKKEIDSLYENNKNLEVINIKLHQENNKISLLESQLVESDERLEQTKEFCESEKRKRKEHYSFVKKYKSLVNAIGNKLQLDLSNADEEVLLSCIEGLKNKQNRLSESNLLLEDVIEELAEKYDELIDQYDGLIEDNISLNKMYGNSDNLLREIVNRRKLGGIIIVDIEKAKELLKKRQYELYFLGDQLDNLNVHITRKEYEQDILDEEIENSRKEFLKLKQKVDSLQQQIQEKSEALKLLIKTNGDNQGLKKEFEEYKNKRQDESWVIGNLNAEKLEALAKINNLEKSHKKQLELNDEEMLRLQNQLVITKMDYKALAIICKKATNELAKLKYSLEVDSSLNELLNKYTNNDNDVIKK